MPSITNPVSEALRQAHKALLADLRDLEQALAVSLKDAGRVAERLKATAGNIARHFAFEEQNGYMNLVRKREPRYEQTIQELIVEHAELADSLSTLITRAEACAVVDGSLQQDLQGWIKRVREHEYQENELLRIGQGSQTTFP